jgi:hypothetical protein
MSKAIIIAFVVVLIVLYLYNTGSLSAIAAPPAPPKTYGPVTWGTKHGYLGHTGTANKLQCPNGTYLSRLYGKYDRSLNSVGAQCSNGTNFGPFGGTTGKDFSANSPAGGWSTISGNSGWWNDNLLGYGGAGGSPYKDVCPPGQYITGMEVNTDGNVVGGLQFGCNTI